MITKWMIDGRLNWPQLEKTAWIQDMRTCMQDPVWHAEGDVLTHTKMVVEALFNLPSYQTLPTYAQEVLQWSALFHDIGKPATTQMLDGRVTSPRHAAVGEKMTRTLLWDMPVEKREHICALVRLHGLPLWALEKENSNRSVIGASLRVPNEWIYLLAQADVLGRIGPNERTYLERTEFYKLLCQEHACFEQPKAFHNAHSRFRFFQTNGAYPAQLFDDTAFEVIMMSGLPGSGKDTVAATLELPVVSLDQIRQELGIKHDDKNGQGSVAQAAYKQAKTYGAKKQSFVWNSTNLTTDMRNRLIHALSVYNPRFRIIYVETSMANIEQRRAENIPMDKLRALQNKLDMPLPEEAHVVEYRRN